MSPIGLYRLVRPLLFSLPAENAHALTLRLLSALPYRAPRESGATEVCGLKFPNRVGLAAGVDKDGLAIGGWFALGFGFVELGTVTSESSTVTILVERSPMETTSP